jgi:hypothetical protein
MANFGQQMEQKMRDITFAYTVAAAPFAAVYTFLVGYPYASSVVNKGLHYGLGNETTFQIPETVDEAVVKTLTVGVTETSWTFQVTTLMMMFGNIINFITFVMTVMNFLFTVVPFIGATVIFICKSIVKVVCFLQTVAEYMAGNDQAVPAVPAPVPARRVRAVRKLEGVARRAQ